MPYFVHSKDGEVIEMDTSPGVAWEPLSRAEGKRRTQEQAKKTLTKLLKKDQTIYAIIRSVSKSGMSRSMDFYIIDKGDMRYITSLMAKTLGWSMSPKQGMLVKGCGMDMVFHTVYSLSYIVGKPLNHHLL